jgi:hypothetical protein
VQQGQQGGSHTLHGVSRPRARPGSPPAHSTFVQAAATRVCTQAHRLVEVQLLASSAAQRLSLQCSARLQQLIGEGLHPILHGVGCAARCCCVHGHAMTMQSLQQTGLAGCTGHVQTCATAKLCALQNGNGSNMCTTGRLCIAAPCVALYSLAEGDSPSLRKWRQVGAAEAWWDYRWLRALCRAQALLVGGTEQCTGASAAVDSGCRSMQ